MSSPLLINLLDSLVGNMSIPLPFIVSQKQKEEKDDQKLAS
jgi:hypothetical protein